MGLLAPVATFAQTALSESFTGPSLDAGLELSLGGSYTFNGVATNSAGQGAYIRTTATNFNLVDFSLLVTYTVSSGSGSGGMAFVGLGSGTPDTEFYTEPLQAVYVRSFPDDFGDGFIQPSINSAPGTVNELATFGTPGLGTHRILLTKTGDTVTFAVDASSSSGTFNADYTAIYSLSADLPFLDATNSRLFVGSQGAGATFDSLVLTTSVPEPAVTGLLTGLGVLCVGIRGRKEAPRNRD